MHNFAMIPSPTSRNFAMTHPGDPRAAGVATAQHTTGVMAALSVNDAISQADTGRNVAL
jgi:hypothetical protein